MAVPIEFLRGVLGVIAVGCAYMTGRTAAAVRKGWQKPARLYGWTIRLLVCLAAVAFRHPVDIVDVIIWALAAVAFSAALWGTSREKKPEDLTSTIFPHER
jgi:hypothetical protein